MTWIHAQKLNRLKVCNETCLFQLDICSNIQANGQETYKEVQCITLHHNYMPICSENALDWRAQTIAKNSDPQKRGEGQNQVMTFPEDK